MPRKKKKPGYKKGIREIIPGEKYEAKVFWNEGKERLSKSKTVYGAYEQAQQVHLELQLASKRGHLTPRSNATLNDVLDAYLASADFRDSTRYSFTRMVDRYLRPALGESSVEALEPSDFKGLYQRLGTKTDGHKALSRATVSMVHRYARMALQYATEGNLLSQNPLASVRPPRATKADAMKPLSREDLLGFLDATKATKWRPLFYVLAFTGMRIGEAVALEWSDFDPGAATLTVRQSAVKVGKKWSVNSTKNGRQRKVTLPKGVVSILEDHRAQSSQTGSYIFCGPKGDPADKRSIDRSFKRVLRIAGLPPIRLHDLRHTHATLLINDRWSIKAVSERLGHASVETTLRLYVHADTALQRDIASGLDVLLSGLPGREAA